MSRQLLVLGPRLPPIRIMGHVDVFVDGSCLSNGTPNARAGIGVWFANGHPWNVSQRLDGRQTNNRAEIIAACVGIEQALRGYSSVTVHTDSWYVKMSITEWMKRWENNGWRTASGGMVYNQEDFVRLNYLCRSYDVGFLWEPGHDPNNYGNKRADQLANAGALQNPSSDYYQ